MKTCYSCKQSLPISAYYQDRANPENPKGYCRDCTRRKSREWRSANREYAITKYKEYVASLPPDVHRDRSRVARWKHKYGITPDERDRMEQAQGGLCALCRTPPSDRRGLLLMDHCHTTGQLRQLLCMNCNTGIGLFGDDPDLLEMAAAYLRRHAGD